jgi:hypothetical protein
MRTRIGAESIESRGGTARNDGLHPIDGGSTGAVPSFISTTEELGPGTGSSIGEGKGAVGKKAWFAPVDPEPEIQDCPGGVCPVPWAVKEEAPVLQGDNVNHPTHYTDGGIECIEAIEASLTPDEYRGYLKGNIQKYVWRERLKGGTESLKKAQWYIDRLIQLDEIQKG